MKAIKICKIRANDEPDGEIIRITAVPHGDDGETGYTLVASNGDDVGYFRPKTIEELREDAYEMWSCWCTYAPAV